MESVEKKQEPGGLLVDAARRVVKERFDALAEGKKELASKLIFAQKGIRIVVLAGVLMAAGCGQILPPQEPPTPTPTTTTSETQKTDFSIRTIGDLRFEFSPDNSPISYETTDGKKVIFDQKELEETRKKALLLHEPEIFKITRISESPASEETKGSTEHPVLSELPSDVMTESELKEKGIEIIQAKNTNFYIRKGAFGKDAPLEDFASGKNKLKIILLDAPYVSDIFMSDPRIQDARAAYLGRTPETKIDIDEFKNKKIKEIRDLIDKAKKSANPEDIIDKKLRLYDFQQLSRTDLLTLAAYPKKPSVGLYAYTSEKEFIFIAIGKPAKTSQDMVIVANAYGKFDFFYSTVISREDAPAISSSDSFPNPANYKLNPSASPDNPNSYPYASRSPGFSVQHELAHSNFIGTRIRTGGLKIVTNPNDPFHFNFVFSNNLPTLEPNRSEYDTDMRAANRQRLAWQIWKESGYKNNSGYHFAFSLPQGGYILTEDMSNPRELL